ncbi:MAG: hypothetical protein QFE16_03185 [Pseudomonadota bacterium]|nr:hypothetical protein [Pseudomonadota bacterium]
MASIANHVPCAAEVLVLVAHPALEQSRVNRRLLRAQGPIDGA